ncbi:choice-of-anchor J domain-containing protein [Flavobacterium sp. JP2137]|uniref:choice-of-anchor J domain-containing protein n=1 Tax=Flavobacterium sp. JP2137 TaxID=3414510 RepID=UPI003D2FBC83
MNLKLFLCSLTVLVFTGSQAQNEVITIFEDSFETYEDFAIENIGHWTVKDIDQQPTYGPRTTTEGGERVDVTYPNARTPYAFMVFTPKNTTPPLINNTWDAHTGEKYMSTFACRQPQGAPEVIANDDWLISPKIKLLEEHNKLIFWAKSYTAAFGLERFIVGISTTDTEVASFKMISEGDFVEAPDDWTEFIYDLDQYAGKEIHIAIRCVSVDAFMLFIDDFAVVKDSRAHVNKRLANQFKIFPNPAHEVLMLSNTGNLLVSRVVLKDIHGRIVKYVNFNDALITAKLDVSTLQSGVYLLEITTDEGSFTKKIIKR